jgi:hypothetical protein
MKINRNGTSIRFCFFLQIKRRTLLKLLRVEIKSLGRCKVRVAASDVYFYPLGYGKAHRKRGA